jgi:hypothetical protein
VNATTLGRKNAKHLGHLLDIFVQRGVLQAVTDRRGYAPAFTPSFGQKSAAQWSREDLDFHGLAF